MAAVKWKWRRISGTHVWDASLGETHLRVQRLKRRWYSQASVRPLFQVSGGVHKRREDAQLAAIEAAEGKLLAVLAGAVEQLLALGVEIPDGEE